MVKIRRIAYTDDGTFGVIFKEDVPFALTVEKEWKDNAPYISCIPNGTYVCKRVNSPKFGNTFEVTQVAGRTHILFHKGNTEDDLHGCIAVGEEFGTLNGKTAVLRSGKGFAEFMQNLTGKVEFELEIS